MKNLSTQDMLEMYRYLVLARMTEERMVEYHHHTALPELPHASIGQEAVSVGSCYGLSKEDQILPSLRTRGAFIVKGITSRTMMAGAFAKATGAARGKNTSHHMGDKSVGVMAGTAVVGSHLPAAVGVALACKIRKQDYVTVAYFGDGATNRGDFHEALNMAAIWKLPVVFICENNRYAISTPIDYHIAIPDIAERAKAYGMPGVIVDGNDVLAVYEAAHQAYDRARNGEGPTLLECKTYRWRNHSERDPRDLRPKEEIEEWKGRCPIKRFEKYLLEKGITDDNGLKSIREKVKEEIEDAIRYAEESPFPAGEEALLNVYCEKEV